MLENVEEFKTWGPLNRGHHPIKAKQGNTFDKFMQQLTDLGYEVQFRELVAADYGAPTMRKRFFLIARCDGKPIVWPEPTHAPADSEEVKAGLLKPYVGAYTQLDFSLPCPSIFDTSEEIKEKYGIRAVRPLDPSGTSTGSQDNGAHCQRIKKICVGKSRAFYHSVQSRW